MSYRTDPIYQAVRNLRRPETLLPALKQALPGWSFSPAPAAMPLAYLNYKPFERARMVVPVSVCAGNGEAHASIEALVVEVREQPAPPDVTRADGVSPPLFAIPEWGAQGWTLHNAPELGNLVKLHDPNLLRARVKRALGDDPGPVTIDLLRYVPRKRAILTITPSQGSGRIYAKLSRRKDAEVLAECFGAIDWVARTGALGFRVPAFLSHEPALDTVFMSEVPGQPFTAAMRRLDSAAYAAVGASLASLHRIALGRVATWTTEDQLHDLCRHLGGMARAMPALAARINGLVATLVALEPKNPQQWRSPIHGNLFGDQILWDGVHVGIVDWDRLALGDPLYDLGRLLAHHVFDSATAGVPAEGARACAGALIETYGRADGCAVDDQRLAWHVAVELLLRAKISALRPLRPGWSGHCARAIAECERLIAGNGAFAALPALAGSMEHVA
ncbi:MAG: phosphotransferase [Alphaproteobacteria bacterium]|nr:phosphotransferase [Alphaproteobacteria bacterium]